MVPLAPQDLGEASGEITGFTLANGLRFNVMEPHESPTIAFHTYVKAGSVFDPSGQTGMAHMLEHLTFHASRLWAAWNALPL